MIAGLMKGDVKVTTTNDVKVHITTNNNNTQPMLYVSIHSLEHVL